MSEPTHSIFDQLDPDWVKKQCEFIIDTFDPTETANSSGKFFHNYETWHFHKSSQLPIVRKFIEIIEQNSEKFEEIYGRECRTDFVLLTRTEDNSEEMCVWHKDKYFLNGQFHISVEGDDGFVVEKDSEIEEITKVPGQVWYLNGTTYYHKITVGSGMRRLELCAPINLRSRYRDGKMLGVDFEDPFRYIDGNNEQYTAYRKWVAEGVEEAIKRGTATNVSVSYAVDPKSVV